MLKILTINVKYVQLALVNIEHFLWIFNYFFSIVLKNREMPFDRLMLNSQLLNNKGIYDFKTNKVFKPYSYQLVL